MKYYDCVGMIGHGDPDVHGAFYTADVDDEGENNVITSWVDVMTARTNRPFDCVIWRTCFSGAADSTIKAEVKANYTEMYRFVWAPNPIFKCGIGGINFKVYTSKLAKKIQEAND